MYYSPWIALSKSQSLILTILNVSLFSVSQFISKSFIWKHNNYPFWYSNFNTQAFKIDWCLSLLKMLLCPFDITPVLIKYLLYDIISDYSITLYFLCSRSEFNNFLKDLWILLLGIGSRNWSRVFFFTAVLLLSE